MSIVYFYIQFYGLILSFCPSVHEVVQAYSTDVAVFSNLKTSCVKFIAEITIYLFIGTSREDRFCCKLMLHLHLSCFSIYCWQSHQTSRVDGTSIVCEDVKSLRR